MAVETAGEDKPARGARPRRERGELVYRHTLFVRLAHWLNALCVAVLLMSGLQIFNAHPMLHWGIKGDEADPAIFSITAEESDVEPTKGLTQIGPYAFDTTGVLGFFTDRDGSPSERAFPWWITLPSYPALAEGRRWHFFFAWLLGLNGLAYLGYGFARGHFRRDLAPSGRELSGIGRTIRDHLTFRHPRGEAAKRYNVLQMLAYLTVIFVILPLMVVSGITMSPGIDSAAPFLPELFGGRQSARTIHFVTASLLVLFVIVHVGEVFIAGVFNEMRSMITGWFRIRPERKG
jgi:thiosulfate reductase cytochrome b subunit